MGNRRFEIGDRVRIKSLDWYNENKSKRGFICFDYANFIPEMTRYCGEILTINQVVEEHKQYFMSECVFAWTDEMIEGLAEEETLIEKVDDNGLPFNEWLSHKGAFHVPEDYVLKDENGNVINATKIVLEKKKKEYPKTYCECKNILGLWDIDDTERGYYKADLIDKLQMLLICRDAYWKIAGEEMGLGKPWSPSGNEDCFVISRSCGEVYLYSSAGDCEPFEFPTEEMRDAFYENFKEGIESVKELL